MKADALMSFILSGNRSLEEFAVLLARISLGVFFAISGANKLFVASQYKLMYETIVGAGIPFPHVMTYFGAGGGAAAAPSCRRLRQA